MCFITFERSQTDPWFTIRQMRPDGIERVRKSVENEYMLIGRIVGIGALVLKNAELRGMLRTGDPWHASRCARRSGLAALTARDISDQFRPAAGAANN